MKLLDRLSNHCLHFFHVVSNVRPIVWIGLYVAVTPLYALIYWLLPECQFRSPDEAVMDFGSCLYYSIVTITTLGFGDFTPTHALSQAVTACEVMTGLIVLGLFLNAVGSMKSEIDVESAVEKQRLLHFNAERDKLVKNTPLLIHHINAFLSACYYMTTPADKRESDTPVYNPDFSMSDMAGMFDAVPSTGNSALETLISSGRRTSLFFDSVQNRVDLSLWPELLENFFSFVANEQMFEATDLLAAKNSGDEAVRKAVADALRGADGVPVSAPSPYADALNALFVFIRTNAGIALEIESALSQEALSDHAG